MSNANDFIVENGVLKKYVGPGGIVRIPEGITEIGVCAFIMNSGVKKVHIPHGVSRIRDGAFYGCKSLLSVVIPDSVTEICREAFSGCSVLEGLELPNGVKTIAFGAFYGCERLKKVTLPDSVSALGNEAFRNCRDLADEQGFVIVLDTLFGYYGPGGDVTVPDGVRRICNGTFHTGGEITSLTLPDSVVELGDDLFQNCENLADENGFVILRDVFCAYCGRNTNVVIPEGVSKIGRNAFFMDNDIRDIVLPKGLTQIGISAFYGCKKLSSVQIPEGVTVIGHNAFHECFSLSVLEIPDSVKWIGDRIFQGCGMLKELKLPREVSYMGADVFYGCRNLTSVVLPEGVTRIDTRTFAGCIRLAEITIPKSVNSVGSEAFKDCRSLVKVTISGTTVTLGSNAFRGISDQAVIFSPGIPIDLYQTAAEKRAAARGFMQWMDRYQDAAIADSYKNYIIGQRKSLLPCIFQQDLVQMLALFAEKKKITINNFETEYMGPAQGAKAVGCVAYLMDWSSANITAKALQKKDQRELTKDPFNVTDMKKLWSYETMEDGSLMITSYKGKETEVFVPERIGKTPVTRLDDGAFGIITKTGSAKPKKQVEVLQAIQSVSIPASVTAIGSKAFFMCKGLQKVELPDSVTEIGELAFFGCENLVDGNGFIRVRDVVYGYNGPSGRVIIPQGVTYIVDSAFVNCNSFVEVELPDSVTSVGSSAFQNCRNLKSIRLSANLNAISDFAFSGCSSLQSVEIPQSVTKIGLCAFSECKKLAKLILPEKMPDLGRNAFRMCDKLADENGFVVVGGVLFRYCGSGGDITIPDGVTAIENEAFALRKKLISVVVPDGVTRIGYCAFNACSNLKRIVIPASVTEMSMPFGWGNDPEIHAPAGSYAEAYAKENKIPFVAE